MKNYVNKKVILAFSGGLDTSFCVPYLKEKGFEVITVTIDSGGISLDEKSVILNKSKKLGTVKHYFIDAKDYYFNSMISWIIMSNGLYEGSYPNIVSSQRYHIVEKCIEIAKKEGAHYFADGNSGSGNDQVRFSTALSILAPHIKHITPIKEIGGNREYEKEYLKMKGFPIDPLFKKYTTNTNILGISYSGSEIDEHKEPDNSLFHWVTGEKSNVVKYIKIGFDKGLPISIDGKMKSGVKILESLNETVGLHGFGKGYYTGDCMIGIKGHLVFEAPGILFLIVAHKALEQYVLTKPQIQIGALLSEQLTDYIFNGKWFDPVVKDLKSFFMSQQKQVTGEVLMKLEYGNALPVSVNTKNSLIDTSIASYAQSKSWTKEDVDGFIKLYGLQTIIAAKKQNMKGGELP